MTRPPLPLFAACGIELEYMIVDAASLDVKPIADDLLTAAAGELTGDYENGPIGWSNELALHVIEMKTAEPAPSLEPLPALFQKNVNDMNRRLAALGARLMPSAMHPWMDPDREMQLWPHEYNEVYRAFDRVFDCRGHGWANLQSVHMNLPFASDSEFGLLHAATRLLLPPLPPLAAAPLVIDGRTTGRLDNRLEVYRHNARRVPLVSARVVPEPAWSRAEYEAEILEPLYRAIAPVDTGNILQHEWLNARGAIARFDRGAIEIRVLDIQECPQADLAVCAAVWNVLRWLTAGDSVPTAAQQAVPTEPLAELLERTITAGEQTLVNDPAYLELLLGDDTPRTAGAVWRELLERAAPALLATEPWAAPLATILNHGPLARRLLRRLGDSPSRELLHTTYRELADCLADGRMFG